MADDDNIVPYDAEAYARYLERKTEKEHYDKLFGEKAAKAKPKDKAKDKGRKKQQDATELVLSKALREEEGLFRGDLFKLDTFSGQTLLMHPIPQDGIAAPASWSPRDTTDVDVTQLMMWLQGNGYAKVARNRVDAAIAVEAQRNAFSAAQDVLARMPKWDGVHRLERFWIDVCGAVEADEGMSDQAIVERGRYLRETARCFFIGIVARIMSPGCKVDTMPVLEGEQGTLKSTLLRVIAFDKLDWFSDSLPPNLGDKDAKQHLPGKLIIEMAELNHMSHTKVEGFKSFQSTQIDKYRPSYGRREVTHKRQCVFVGTTNAGDYLVDMTGNRRFWPITCGNIDIEKARNTIKQLYAEAYSEYRAGAQWWLSREVELMAEAEQRERMVEDMWEHKIREWLAGARHDAKMRRLSHVQTTIAEIAEKVIPISETQRFDKSAQTRIGITLAKLGGKRKRRTNSTGQYWCVVFPSGQGGQGGPPNLSIVPDT